MSKKSSKPSSSGSNPYIEWLMLIPEAKRDLLVESLAEEPITDSQSFARLTMKVMMGLAGGHLAPEVSREMRGWGELLYTALATQEMKERGGSGIEAIFGAIKVFDQKAKKITDSVSFDEEEVNQIIEMATITEVNDESAKKAFKR